MSHRTHSSTPPPVHVTHDREFLPRPSDDHSCLLPQQPHLAAAISTLSTPNAIMDRQSRRPSCPNSEAIHSRHMHTLKPTNAVCSNIISNPLTKTETVAGTNTNIDLSSDPSRIFGGAIDVPYGEEQYQRSSRTLFVSAPRVCPPVSSHPNPDPTLCLPRPPLDTSSFVLVRYTNLSVSPGGGVQRIEPASRSPYAFGYGLSGMQASGNGSITAPDPGGGVSAFAVSGVSGGISTPMQQMHGTSLLRPAPSLNSTAGFPAPSRSYNPAHPPTSTLPNTIPMHFPPTLPTYKSHLEPSIHGEPGVVRPASYQGVQRSQWYTPAPREVGDRFVAPGVTNRNRDEQQLKEWRLNQIQDIHPYPYHHQPAYQQLTQPNEQYGRDMLTAREESQERFQQNVQQVQSSAHVTQYCPSRVENGIQTQHHNGASARPPIRVPSLERVHIGHAHGMSHRADSVSATPTTSGTPVTQPISTSPSSPDNNGSSSNGSVQREFPCQYPGCPKTFDRRYNLTVHYRRHTDEMPYPCKFAGCAQKFKWRSSQSHHMKTRHGIGRGGRVITNGNSVNRGSGASGSGVGVGQEVNGGSGSRTAQGQASSAIMGGAGRGSGGVAGVAGGGDMRMLTHGREESGESGKVGFSPQKRAKVQRRGPRARQNGQG